MYTRRISGCYFVKTCLYYLHSATQAQKERKKRT
nr:MAG TPA_asm: hypothetical protein [Bacteriophage sp.]DAT19616.1 MAG TPA: hypothetical protein [Bacteriophage sp.]DAW97409.1 MAG TPA: hypothetical protein [Bacteriophage sp.]